MSGGPIAVVVLEHHGERYLAERVRRHRVVAQPARGRARPPQAGRATPKSSPRSRCPRRSCLRCSTSYVRQVREDAHRGQVPSDRSLSRATIPTFEDHEHGRHRRLAAAQQPGCLTPRAGRDAARHSHQRRPGRSRTPCQGPAAGVTRRQRRVGHPHRRRSRSARRSDGCSRTAVRLP